MRRTLQSLLLALSLSAPSIAFAGPALPAAPVETPLPKFTNIVLDATSIDGTHVYSQADASTLVSGLELFLLAGVDRQDKHQGGVAALTAEMLVDMPVQDHGKTLALQDAIRLRGGLLATDIEGQNVHFYLEARNDQLADCAKLFAGVLAAPSFDQATFRSALTVLRARVSASRENPLSAGTLMFRDAFYATTNAGQPPLGTLADLDRVTRGDAATFFRSAYRRGGASAIVVGDAGSTNIAAAKNLLATLAPGSSQVVHVSGRPALPPNTSIISFRHVSAPWVLLGFPAPTADSSDFGAMLVLSAILEDTFVRESTTSVPLIERPIGLQYDFHSSPATVVLYVDGAAIDESVALRELGVLRMALGSSALNAQYVNRYKSMAEGTYLNDVASLAQRAEEIASLANLGLGADGVNLVLKKIDTVTVSDVQRVVKRYFDASTPSFVLPRNEESR